MPTPVELLADAGFTAMAASLRGAQNGAAETRDGIYQTARTAAKAMTDPEIMAWVTPPRRGCCRCSTPRSSPPAATPSTCCRSPGPRRPR